MLIKLQTLTLVFGIGFVASMIAAIVLGVQKSQLNDRIEELESMLPASTEYPEYPSPPVNIDYRLPRSLRPLHYDLQLNPYIENGTFRGAVSITIECVEPTKLIVLHSLDLMIESVKVTGLESNDIVNRDYDEVRECLMIELEKEIEIKREFNLNIEFEGSMLNKIVGLYSSSYLKPDKSRRWIATSKFEPTYARQAFPCFDEPDLKATFHVTLVHPIDERNYHALSNMNINSETIQGSLKEVHFNKSVPMSTYLVCFIVSDFEKDSVLIDASGIGENFELNAYATEEQIGKVKFALDSGKRIMEYYIDYFKLEYPLPKLDMVAIPDFASGAMENWGLITYRETSLLFEKGSTINKQRVAAVVAHEFAHMWFGNLVTMKWWNDLWLNEGFAKYIEHKALSSVYGTWNMEDQFITNTLHDVMSLDGTLASHPIVQPVENPDQITEIFDSITYSKGASVIRMLEDFLTPEVFRKAVQTYLIKFKYGNAVTADFLDVINDLTGEDIKSIMDTWLQQMGLPVINVQRIDKGTIKLTQKRFLSNPNDYSSTRSTTHNYKWSIPITLMTNENAEVQRSWCYYDQVECSMIIEPSTKWYKLNINQTGYYRVNYDDKMWKVLASELRTSRSSFSVGDRASLLNDAFALADATQLSYNVPLELMDYLRNEEDYVPWNVAASQLVSLKRSLLYTDIITEYTKYARELIEPIHTALHWTIHDSDENHLRNLLASVILNAACSLGLEDCLNEASLRFGAWLEDPSEKPHPDIRDTVYYFGMLRCTNEGTWDQMWRIFIAEQDASEKIKLMKGLAAIKEPWILNRYIHLAWNEDYIRRQDYFNCLQYIASNPIGESIVWDYVREHWTDLVERFGLNDRSLGNLIPSITKHFNTNTKLQEMEEFFKKYPEAGAGTAARNRALNNVKNNIAWLEHNLNALREWLTQCYGHPDQTLLSC